MQNVKSISFLKAQTQLLRYKLSKRYFTQIFRPTQNDEDDFEAHFDIFSKFLSDNFENVKSELYETFEALFWLTPPTTLDAKSGIFWSKKNSWIFKKGRSAHLISVLPIQNIQDVEVYENL